MNLTGTILLAGGGTGGHVFPLVALAEAFADVAPLADLVFVGTSKGLEARVIPERGWKLETLNIEPMKGRSLFGAARGGMIAGAAAVRAVGLVAKLKPILCVSIGGYAAGPVGVAAASLGVPLALLEPNRVAGLTQKLLAPLSKRVYVGFREALTGSVRWPLVGLAALTQAAAIAGCVFVASRLTRFEGAIAGPAEGGVLKLVFARIRGRFAADENEGGRR